MITRSEFLSLKFPNLPYCEAGLKRGASCKYYESLHYRNLNTKKQINVYWNYNGYVTIGVYDKSKKDRYKNTTVYSEKHINDDIIEKYCHEFLT
jgi:hypothetical protein